MRGILDSNASYERWIGQQIPIIQPDLEFKHSQMRTSCFAFMRATFYRWAEVFGHVSVDLMTGPKILAVGDLHAENFGTWRDAEGRLVWGINDFDEVSLLPYSFDLVRLGVSIQLAIETNQLRLSHDEAIEAILAGYEKSLRQGGKPFVLAEEHQGLRKLATGVLRSPSAFWTKLDSLPSIHDVDNPIARAALWQALPIPNTNCRFRARRSGLGSLGRPRYVAIAEWMGGFVAREAKALAPSAAEWAGLSERSDTPHYSLILSRAIRCQDPFVQFHGKWLIRRLAPDCSRIELSQLPEEREELRLVEAMGRETANVHLGTPECRQALLDDLKKLPGKWLKHACNAMFEAVQDDFKAFVRG
ncbi:MAG: DUF2252 family protein [Fimbriimonas sp.]|nr:DUF2252 family protein [Fimbriimonas sp.]